MTARVLIRLVVATLCAAPAYAADGLTCSAFLHEKDGKWRSFDQADVLGPNGVVHLQSGEQISPTDTSSKGDIARALNNICEK